MMSRSAALLQHILIDSSSIVSNANAQLALVVVKLDFHVRRARMTECIAERFADDSIDVVLNDRRKIARLSFDLDAQGRGTRAGMFGAEGVRERGDGVREIRG